MSGRQFASWEAAICWLLEQPDQQDLVKACYYDRPPLQAADRFHRSEEWKAVRQYFPPTNGRALDVGAGMGIASYALACDGWRTTALEPNASDLVGAGAIRALAREAAIPIDVIEEPGEGLPFDDRSFELVHARQVLHHAQDLQRFCSELCRVLKPGGCLVATREHVVSSDAQLADFLERHPLHSLYGGENAFPLHQYVSALRAAGFQIEQTLGPLESVINYAPFTEDSLCMEIAEKASGVPGGRVVSKVLLAKPWRSRVLKVASLFDRRPGRLYTFVCRKPVA